MFKQAILRYWSSNCIGCIFFWYGLFGMDWFAYNSQLLDLRNRFNLLNKSRSEPVWDAIDNFGRNKVN